MAQVGTVEAVKELRMLSNSKDSSEFPRPFLVWCVGFAYASFLALTLQKLLLPLLPSLHAEHGLLQNDAIYFHNVAVELAARIRTIGWSEWQFFPAAGATANVGVLAALYAFLGPDPAWFIPLNAAAHATGALMLYLLAPIIWPGNVGRLGGLVAAVLFLAFPTALQWYGQNHKDAFSIAGTLIILFAWLRAGQFPSGSLSGGLKDLSLAFLGTVLIASVRPYFLLIVALALLASWVVAVLASIAQRKLGTDWRGLTFSMALLAMVAGVASLAPKDRDIMQDAPAPEGISDGISEGISEGISWRWQQTELLPRHVDKLFERASSIRAGFIAYGFSVGAGSMLDANRYPNSAASVLAYTPRALVVGLFAPFPDSWTERPTMIRVVGAIETLIWYLLFPGVLLLAVLRPNRAFLLGAVFCGAIIVALSYAHPNLGTLYRQRFGVLFFFILCGAIGWSRVVLGILSAASPRPGNVPMGAASNVDPYAPLSPGMTRVAASGAIVLAISIVSFLGFMVRDLLLVKSFGMGVRLDAFFSAAMIPMFFVAFLAFPFADAMTTQFLRAGSAEGVVGREHLARSLLSFASIILAAVGILLVVTADQVVILILGGGDPEQIEEAATMLRWLTPILMFSGWTVIGNSVLNALQRSRAAALAQMSVPAIAIAAILVFGQALGLYAAIYGMLAGLATNIALVTYAMKGQGLRLMPARMSFSPLFIAVLRNYSLLALAALLAAAAVPVNYVFAGMIGTGAVSAWALGSKMVQLVTGMAGVAIGAVILPHLGGLIAHGRLSQLKSDVYFLLMSGTWISIICTLTIYGFSEPLVVAVFEGGEVTREQAVQLAAILKLGSLQLPFVIATTLILKLAAVSGTSLRAVVATGAGLALNVALNLVLVPQSGVLGIATATAIAAGFSATYLVLATRKQCGLDFVEVAVLLGSWIALLGLSVALHFRSVAAVASSGLALLILAWAQWWVWQKRSPISDICKDTG